MAGLHGRRGVARVRRCRRRQSATCVSSTPPKPATRQPWPRCCVSAIDVNAPEPDGTTPLHWAVRQDDLQLAGRAHSRRRRRESGQPLRRHRALSRRRQRQRRDDRGAARRPAPMRTRPSPEGETALMTAARTGNVAAARVLLAHGARVDARERLARPDGVDVGGGAKPSGNGPRADRERRGRERTIRRPELGAADHGGTARKVAAARAA